MLQPKHTQDTYRKERDLRASESCMVWQVQTLAQRKGAVEGLEERWCSLFPPYFSFLLGLKLKSMEEKIFISGTNEAPGPWRVDLVVQYYKIYFRKKQARSPRSSPNVSWSGGSTSTSGCWMGERVIAEHWCWFMMKQHKSFPAL